MKGKKGGDVYKDRDRDKFRKSEGENRDTENVEE
jgi:hypothetical protein